MVQSNFYILYIFCKIFFCFCFLLSKYYRNIRFKKIFNFCQWLNIFDVFFSYQFFFRWFIHIIQQYFPQMKVYIKEYFVLFIRKQYLKIKDCICYSIRNDRKLSVENNLCIFLRYSYNINVFTEQDDKHMYLLFIRLLKSYQYTAKM